MALHVYVTAQGIHVYQGETRFGYIVIGQGIHVYQIYKTEPKGEVLHVYI